MQWNDKTVHNCHTRIWWHFLLHCQVLFSSTTHSCHTDHLNEATLREKSKTKKPFLYQTEGQHLACIILEVLKM